MKRFECFSLLIIMWLLMKGQSKQMKMIHLDNRADDEFPSEQERYTKSATLISNDQLNILPPEFILCLRSGEALSK